MKINELTLGFADAEKEFLRIPKYFDIVFYDPKNIVNKLINGWEFLLCGRKGVGKTAYNVKIQSMSNDNMYTSYLPLNDFEYSTFEKTNVDKNVTGTQKYKISWDFTLLLEIFKVIVNKIKITEISNISKAVEVLDKLGFSMEFSLKKSVNALSKVKVGANLGIFDAEYKKQFESVPYSFSERIGNLNEYLIDTLSKVAIYDKKIVLLIDGVDDILRIKKNQKEILASLIRSVDYLNTKLFKNEFKIKIVLFMREDILYNITDPDINKIIRDSSVNLNWGDKVEQLSNLLYQRFTFSKIDIETAKVIFKNMFPAKVKDKNIWDYILEFTLYKPRDVIQFFKSCQELFPENEKLVFSELNQAIKHYSSQYFINEMKNELAGFVDDELITILPSVFRKLGNRAFSLNKIVSTINNQFSRKKYAESEIKYLLYLLFESGYIGNLTKNIKGQNYIKFKYRNPAYQIDYDDSFLIHKGIYSGLGIKL